MSFSQRSFNQSINSNIARGILNEPSNTHNANIQNLNPILREILAQVREEEQNQQNQQNQAEPQMQQQQGQIPPR
jgi:hypothetical protein